jgi:hypothetical protein
MEFVNRIRVCLTQLEMVLTELVQLLMQLTLREQITYRFLKYREVCQYPDIDADGGRDNAVVCRLG